MKSAGNGERAPLRTILQNFLNHVETLERRRNTPDDQYDKEFQDLKLLSESFKGLAAYSCKEGEKEVNRRKNRYKDILPFDATRVSLSEITGIPGSDYINANYIRGASGSQAYIASQGPLVHTVIDFWRMVVECDVQVIIMACNEEESGKHKCECYWADSDLEDKSYGPYTVKLLKSRKMCNDFNLRTMELLYHNATGEKITRTVVQFHYWAWPDHGVPALVRPLLDMVRLIRDCQASETLPLLIHCSAGCGRTGTICAIDFVWGLLRAGKLTEDFSLFELIADMRRQRVAMVQTKDQYILVHRALRELFIEQLKMIDAHPYENLDVNGHPLICPPQEILIDPSYETIFVSVNEDDIVEVNEEDDVCREEPIDQIPWPVLQYQANAVDSVPPLPDKKRKTSSGQVSPSSDRPTPSPGHSKQPACDSSSNETSSKESSPPPSLGKLLLGADETEMAIDCVAKVEEKSAATPKSGLARKSSILKIRAFFEKSNSEPRVEKITKPLGGNTRKSSSFRLRDGPTRFYASLENDALRIPVVGASDEVGRIPTESSANQRAVLDDGGSSSGSRLFFTADQADKPGLPIKRSKSMKVYRGFDVNLHAERRKDSETIVPQPVSPLHSAPSFPCGVVLSKTPSITYISSKEKFSLPNSESRQERDGDLQQLEGNKYQAFDGAPLATGSLDRGKPIPCGDVTTNSVGGSLDRSIVQNRVTPTYVNVLMRNQEAAHVSRLDDGTRQLLQDCQAYLMHDELGNDPVVLKSPVEKHSLDPSAHKKKAKERALKERRHSYKTAVVPNSDEEASPPLNSRENDQKSTSCNSERDSSERVKTAHGEESRTIRTARKAHEYEAIWLGGGEPLTDAAAVNDDLLTETNNSSDELCKQPLPVESASSHAAVSARLEIPISPRLHPDRVLSELQELVEQANRSEEDILKTEAALFPAHGRGAAGKVSPTSPPVSHTSAQAHPPADVPSPIQYARLLPSPIFSAPSAGLVAPVPIKTTTSVSASPSYLSTNSYKTTTSASTAVVNALPPPAAEVAAPAKTEPRACFASVAGSAPAFRPPPPYPTKLHIKLPPVESLQDPLATAAGSTTSSSPTQNKRLPPEYKAPPPVKHPPPSKASIAQPIAPPRSKRPSTSQLASRVAFPKGPPVPTRSFTSSFAPGIDVDAVAAVMAAANENSSRGSSTGGGSSSPTTAANKALSKALGKFHATAASFKTKLATQFGDTKDSVKDFNESLVPHQKTERESSFVKPKSGVVYVADGVTVVNTPDTTCYVRKKQQYL